MTFHWKLYLSCSVYTCAVYIRYIMLWSYMHHLINYIVLLHLARLFYTNKVIPSQVSSTVLISFKCYTTKAFPQVCLKTQFLEQSLFSMPIKNRFYLSFYSYQILMWGLCFFSHSQNNLLPKLKPCFLIEKHINLPAVLYFYKAKQTFSLTSRNKDNKILLS